MSNKKQTAVEWLEDALAENLKNIIVNSNSELMEWLFQRAKQMEKEQIMKAFNAGTDEEAGNTGYISDENYYRQTYGNDR